MRHLAYFVLASVIGLAVPSGTAHANFIINGDFSAGNTGFTSGYTFIPAPGTSATPGTYAVRTNPQLYNPGLDSFGDHTTGTGNMMLIDGSGSASLVVWSETIAVVPNTTYDFSAWAASTYPLIPSVLGFEANGVQLGSDLNLPATTGQWQQFTASWNSGSNTSLTLAIFDRNTVTTRPGNDFALDDLSLTTSVFAVPEPSSLLLMLTGGGAFGFVRRGRGRCGSPAADGVAGDAVRGGVSVAEPGAAADGGGI